VPANTKPSEGNRGHRSIIVADWKPLAKNILRGFFTAAQRPDPTT